LRAGKGRKPVDKMRIAWVTGAGGFMGRHAVRRLAADGWSVVGIGETTPDAAAIRAWGFASWRTMALTPDALERLAGIAAPDAVFHAAGVGAVAQVTQDPLRAFDRTVRSTAVLLDTLRRTAPQARFIYPSSAAVYGERGESALPLEEDSSCAPISAYGWHKLGAELLIREAVGVHGLSGAAIRFFSVYGPELRKQVVWDWTRRMMRANGSIIMSGSANGMRDFLSVDDATKLISLLAGSAPRGAFTLVNGGTGHGVTMGDLARLIAETLERPLEITFDGRTKACDPLIYRASTRRAEALGFIPRVPVAEGIRRYVTWIRSQA
jgi:UDP-glucose 4-epimerase